MRRALEYVKPFGGGGRPARAGSAAGRPARLRPRGRAVRPARAARLAGGGRGGDHRPRRACWPSTPARGCTSATSRPRGIGRGAALGQGARHRRHRRGHAAPPAADRRPAGRGYDPVFKVNPPLRTGRRRRRRCGPGWPTAPSTPSPPTTPRTPRTTRSTRSATRPSACSGCRPRSAWSPRRWSRTGLLDWAGVADRMSVAPGARSAGSPATAGRSRSGEPANLTLVDPDAGWTVVRPRLASIVAQHPVRRAARCRAGSSRRSCAAGRPCSTAPVTEVRRMTRLELVLVCVVLFVLPCAGHALGLAAPRVAPGRPAPRCRRRRPSSASIVRRLTGLYVGTHERDAAGRTGSSRTGWAIGPTARRRCPTSGVLIDRAGHRRRSSSRPMRWSRPASHPALAGKVVGARRSAGAALAAR